MNRPALTLHVNPPLDPRTEQIRAAQHHLARAISDANDLLKHCRGINKEIARCMLGQIDAALIVVNTMAADWQARTPEESWNEKEV